MQEPPVLSVPLFGIPRAFRIPIGRGRCGVSSIVDRLKGERPITSDPTGGVRRVGRAVPPAS